jgi:hypothetical protein
MRQAQDGLTFIGILLAVALCGSISCWHAVQCKYLKMHILRCVTERHCQLLTLHSIRGMMTGESQSTQGKNCNSATLHNMYQTQDDLGLNPGLCGERS